MKSDLIDTSESTNYVNLERLTFLFDGVYAITITLLVLELRPPEQGLSQLADGLLGMLPRLFIYFIAFYTLTNHWAVHQRMFRHITEADSVVLWLTLLGLLFITLIPVTTALVGRFPREKLAVACFSANSFFQALTNWFFWIYVVKKQKQFAAHSDPRLLAITAQVWLVISIGWLISILLGYINVNAAYVAWVAWPNLVAVWAKYERRKLQTFESLEHRQKIRNKKK
ncbi:MAG: TMEM175 family protein [Anaerolineales bacterium]|jgi:uncharacterized membrane protein